MLRLQSLSLVNRRRTLRALYAQTQAYPYAAKLSADQDLTDSTKNQLAAVTADSIDGVAAIYPGAIMTRNSAVASELGEYVALATDDSHEPFGLSANFVGGLMDELHGATEIGVWRGRGGVFEVLAPVFDTALTDSSDYLGCKSSAANAEIGRLSAVTPNGSTIFAAARMIDSFGGNDNAIIVELVVGG